MADISGDAPVTQAQLRLALKAQSDQLLEEMIEHMTGIETRLLTAFQRWAAPMDRRVRKLEVTDNDLGERLAIMEERISDLERRR